jgi:hypothetical protein
MALPNLTEDITRLVHEYLKTQTILKEDKE